MTALPSKKTTLRQRRLMLGDAALLSVQEAAELLPRDTKLMRDMLANSGRYRTQDGVPYILWGDALDVFFAHCDEAAEAQPTKKGQARKRPRRRKLK